MILADTSIWIEFLKRKRPIFDHMLFLLEQREIVTAEVIFGELLQGTRNKRERTVILAYWENLPMLACKDLWIESGLRSGEQRWLDQGLGLIDASILLTAEHASAEIWTLDKKLARVVGKAYVPRL